MSDTLSDPGREKSAPTVVVALGGHAFMARGDEGTHEQHVEQAQRVCEHLMVLVERGCRLVITHGNGPQVGALLERTARRGDDLPVYPLDVLVAQTEGSLGYYLQQALLNNLRSRAISRFVVTVVTQVVVDPRDPAFAEPSKPVGPFMDEAQARACADEFGWHVGADADRGWRRLVPSPAPRKVIQHRMIHDAVMAGHLVVACGGGGIPVAGEAGEDYVGVEAVIDKDLTSGVLAHEIGADLLVILTNIDGAYLHYGTDRQTALGAVTLAECDRYLEEGHFAPGSMEPKVRAIRDFLQAGGRRALITSAERLEEALRGSAGTHFIGKI